MARQKAKTKTQTRFLSIGGEDSKGNPNPDKFEGYFVGRRQQGVSTFQDGKTKPNFILFFVNPSTGLEPIGLYEKGDLSQKSFEVGAKTWITWLGLRRPEGKMFKQNMFDVEFDPDNKIETDNVVLPESFTGADLKFNSTDSDSDDNEETNEEPDTEPEESTKPLVAASTAIERAKKVQDLLNRKNK